MNIEQLRKRNDRKNALENLLVGAVTTIIFVAIAALVVGIRLALSGGDWACVFSEDPALCAVIQGGLK